MYVEYILSYAANVGINPNDVTGIGSAAVTIEDTFIYFLKKTANDFTSFKRYFPSILVFG